MLMWSLFFLTLLASLYFLATGLAARTGRSVLNRLRGPSGQTGHDRRREERAARLVAAAGHLLGSTALFSRLRISLESCGHVAALPLLEAAWLSGLAFLPVSAVLLTRTLFAAPVAMLAAIAWPRAAASLISRRSRRKAAEAADRLCADVALYLACGIPVAEAVALSAKGAGPYLSDAVRRFNSLVELGADSRTAGLHQLAEAVSSTDLELIAHAVATSSQTGSDIRVIMGAVGDSLRERAAIRRELDSQTVQARLSGRIVAGLPFLFMALSCLVSRDALSFLFGTAPGLIMLAMAVGLDLLGFIWIRSILDIKI